MRTAILSMEVAFHYYILHFTFLEELVSARLPSNKFIKVVSYLTVLVQNDRHAKISTCEFISYIIFFT